MRDIGLTRRLAAAVGVVALALLAAVLVLGLSIRELDRSGLDARHAEQTDSSAERVKSLVVDAETGLRGYALTGRDTFLQPLLAAETDLPEATAALTNARLPTGRANTLADAIASNSKDYVNEYALPLLERLRTDRNDGRDVIATGAGKRRVDQIRDELNELSGIVRRDAETTADAAAEHADQAQALAVGAAVLAIGLFTALLLYLRRAIVAPIQATARAAAALGDGDLSTRVDEDVRDELGLLARSFNEMGVSLSENAAELEAQQAELETQNAELEQQAVELESQAVELEAQTSELETGQLELTDANEELQARSRELEESANALRAAHEQTQLFAQVADALGRVTGLGQRAEVLLSSSADLLGAEVGAVYATSHVDETVPRLATQRGVDAATLPVAADQLTGLAGRAFTERRTLTGAHGDGDLRLESFGAPVAVRRELHVPLRYGDRVLGVLSLGRADATEFTPEEILAVEHLGEQAAVAFDNAIESERRRWLADVSRAVLDSTGDAIRLIGVDGRLLINNPEMRRFERDVYEIEPFVDMADMPRIGKLVADKTADPDAYLARVREIIGNPEQEFVDEYEFIDTHRWVRRFAAPVYTADRDLVGQIFVLRETTEQRQAAALKDELMSTVSHELRTPLSAILGFAELLKARDYEKEERDEYLDTIHTQARRLSDLISDFLDIQRMEQSHDELPMRSIDLAGLLRQQVELFAAQSATHPVRLDIDAEIVIKGDEDHLRRAVTNLISNAIKYSPDGGEVTVEARRRNGDVILAVRDHGIGIPPEAQRRIFDRFYRVDSPQTRKIKGTGLGLALVREIARIHGGDVGVESVEGQGSRFWLKVPAAQAA